MNGGYGSGFRKSSNRVCPAIILIVFGAICFLTYQEFKAMEYEISIKSRDAAAALRSADAEGGETVTLRRQRRHLINEGNDTNSYDGNTRFCLPTPPEGSRMTQATPRMENDEALRNLYQKHFGNGPGTAQFDAGIGSEFALFLGKYCKSGTCVFDAEYFKYGKKLKFHQLFYCEDDEGGQR